MPKNYDQLARKAKLLEQQRPTLQDTLRILNTEVYEFTSAMARNEVRAPFYIPVKHRPARGWVLRNRKFLSPESAEPNIEVHGNEYYMVVLARHGLQLARRNLDGNLGCIRPRTMELQPPSHFIDSTEHERLGSEATKAAVAELQSDLKTTIERYAIPPSGYSL